MKTDTTSEKRDKRIVANTQKTSIKYKKQVFERKQAYLK